jgi:hypothetical protein
MRLSGKASTPEMQKSCWAYSYQLSVISYQFPLPGLITDN